MLRSGQVRWLSRASDEVAAELGRLAEETRSLLAIDSNLVAAALEDLDASMALDLDQQPAELALHLVAHQVATRGAMAISVDVLQPSLAEFLA